MSRAIRAHVGSELGSAKRMLCRAFSEDHTTAEVARSFGLGVFITMLPTLGVGFVVFLVLSSVFESLSKLALVASAVVFNPVVKWGVYALSLGLGTWLLGPVEGVTMADASLDAAPAVVVRLVVGNVILAIAAAVPSYFLSFRAVDRYAGTASGVVDEFRDRLGSPLETTSDGTDPRGAESMAGESDD